MITTLPAFLVLFASTSALTNSPTPSLFRSVSARRIVSCRVSRREIFDEIKRLDNEINAREAELKELEAAKKVKVNDLSKYETKYLENKVLDGTSKEKLPARTGLGTELTYGTPEFLPGSLSAGLEEGVFGSRRRIDDVSATVQPVDVNLQSELRGISEYTKVQLAAFRDELDALKNGITDMDIPEFQIPSLGDGLKGDATNPEFQIQKFEGWLELASGPALGSLVGVVSLRAVLLNRKAAREAEVEEKTRIETEKVAAGEKARIEAEKAATEEQGRIEAGIKAAVTEFEALVEAKKKEAAEEEARIEAEIARIEAEKKEAAKEQARIQAEIEAAAEQEARVEAEKAAAEEEARVEAEKAAAEEEARIVAEKKVVAEDQALIVVEKAAAEEEAHIKAEKKAVAEQQARLQAEIEAAAEEEDRVEAEKAAAEEEARVEAEKAAAEEQALVVAEKAVAEEKARIKAEKKAVAEEQARFQAEKKPAAEEQARVGAEEPAVEEKRVEQSKQVQSLVYDGLEVTTKAAFAIANVGLWTFKTVKEAWEEIND